MPAKAETVKPNGKEPLTRRGDGTFVFYDHPLYIPRLLDVVGQRPALSPEGERILRIPFSPLEVQHEAAYQIDSPLAQTYTTNLPSGAVAALTVNDNTFGEAALGGIRVEHQSKYIGDRSIREPSVHELVKRAAAEASIDLASAMGPKHKAKNLVIILGGGDKNIIDKSLLNGGKLDVLVPDGYPEDGWDPGDVEGLVELIQMSEQNGMGTFLPGVDSNTKSKHMDQLAKPLGEENVSCTSKYKTPISEITALGVLYALKAGFEEKKWDPNQETISVKGLGKVGIAIVLGALQEWPGMKVDIADVRPEIVASVKQMFPDRINVKTPEDIFEGTKTAVPCALGKSVTVEMLQGMQRDGMIIGAENDQIQLVRTDVQKAGVPDPAVIQLAKEKNILHGPDWVVNLGGVLGIDVERAGGTTENASQYVSGVYSLMKKIFEESKKDRSPEDVAAEIVSIHSVQVKRAKGFPMPPQPEAAAA